MRRATPVRRREKNTRWAARSPGVDCKPPQRRGTWSTYTPRTGHERSQGRRGRWRDETGTDRHSWSRRAPERHTRLNWQVLQTARRQSCAAHEAEACSVQRAALVRQGRHGRQRGGDARQPARATKWRTREGRGRRRERGIAAEVRHTAEDNSSAGSEKTHAASENEIRRRVRAGATAVTRAGAEEESQDEQNRHAGDASCGGPWGGTCGRGPDREGEDGREELLRGLRKYAWRERHLDDCAGRWDIENVAGAPRVPGRKAARIGIAEAEASELRHVALALALGRGWKAGLAC
ncbi:hypothetical protein ERJ75_000698500 [Trypanosoma vivax]|nr:hypothetical protein ERJ75_000698500 [Trypanosoma vivax]